VCFGPFCGYFYTYKVSTQNDFHLDLTFTGAQKNYARPAGIAVAAVLIFFILLTMTTSVSSKILPMNDDYLLVMIPPAPDGAEALGIKSLKYDADDNSNTISVMGSVMNRTKEPMSDILAVVEMQDTTGRFPKTVEVPVQPADLAPQATGDFSAMATLEGKPGAFVVKFRFADGPFIPHRDERAPEITITPQQPQ
jgi:hypothetical protein